MGNILGQLLHLHSLLRIHAALLLLRRNAQVVKRVHARDNVAGQADGPRPVSLLLQPRSGIELLDAGNVGVGQVVEEQVEGVAQLAANGQVPDDGV